MALYSHSQNRLRPLKAEATAAKPLDDLEVAWDDGLFSGAR